MKSILFISLVIICTACNNDKKAWEVANLSMTNRTELTQFLQYYKNLGDKEKYKAACFLIENIPNKYSIRENGRDSIYDIDIVRADSLIASLEYSFELRTKTPFLENYTFEEFCEYILPYRVAHEPLQYYWKWDCAQRYSDGDSRHIIEAIHNINSRVKLDILPEYYRNLPKSYSALIHSGYGKCDDRSVLCAMALRSIGIPAVVDFVPFWGSSNNGHSFTTAILPNDSIIVLQNDTDEEKEEYLSRKTPKVYRKTYRINNSKTQYSYSENERPNLFKKNDVLDVTEQHNIGHRDITLSPTADAEVVYLCVFSPNGWTPIASSPTNQFHDIGTGVVRNTNKQIDEAVDLGNGILYLPGQYSSQDVIPTSNPIIVSTDSVKEIAINTNKKERIILERKYPLNKRIVNFARSMRHGIFEGAQKADFSDAEELYRITETPFSRMQQVQINSQTSYRYIRYRRPTGIFSIAELTIFDTKGDPIPFRPIACKAVMEQNELSSVFDSNPLSYFEVNGGTDIWIGLALTQPQKIGAIGFAPRNDDNAISIGDEYELYYWDYHWKNIARKVADSYTISFDQVPQGALLWLHNLTKGREERPFTYEHNHQIWW